MELEEIVFQRSRNSNPAYEVLKVLEDYPTSFDSKILHYGCENGLGLIIAAETKEGRFIGYDSNEYNIIEAKNNKKKIEEKKLFHTNPSNIIFSNDVNTIKEEKYDLIVDSKYHEEKNNIFKKNYDLLKPGGLLMVINYKNTSNLNDCSRESKEFFETIEFNNLPKDFYFWIGKKK